MRRPITFLALLLLLGMPAFGLNDWTLLKHEGRDYVSLENVARFYQIGAVQHAGNRYTMSGGARILRGQIGSAEFYINGLKFNLSYPLADFGGRAIISRMDLTKLLEPVLRPSRIPSAGKIDTVILDPGHGGHDNGATSVYGSEKNFALDVALRARDMLRTMGYKVYMTRSKDVFIPLEERARFAGRFQNALFIAIHFNSSGNAATGVETYTLAPRGVPSMASDGPALSDFVPCPGNTRDAENIALACATHASLVHSSGMYDRGIKHARFVVIRDVTVPGVLIEGGFLSNAMDAGRIATSAYRQQMAASILQAVQNYRNAVGPHSPASMVAAGPDPLKTAPVVMTPTSATD